MDIIVRHNDAAIADQQCFGGIGANRDARWNIQPCAVQYLIGDFDGASLLPEKTVAAVEIDQAIDKAFLLCGIDFTAGRQLQSFEAKFVNSRGLAIDDFAERAR